MTTHLDGERMSWYIIIIIIIFIILIIIILVIIVTISIIIILSICAKFVLAKDIDCDNACILLTVDVSYPDLDSGFLQSPSPGKKSPDTSVPILEDFIPINDSDDLISNRSSRRNSSSSNNDSVTSATVPSVRSLNAKSHPIYPTLMPCAINSGSTRATVKLAPVIPTINRKLKPQFVPSGKVEQDCILIN